MHHLDGAGFAVWREGAVDVGLAECVPEIAVRGPDAASPPRLLLFGSGQRAREEVEVLIDYGLVQERRSMVDHVPAHVGLPVMERMRGDEFFFGAEEGGSGNDVVIAGGSFHGLQICLPV